MSGGWRRAAAGSRGGIGRIVAMAAALAAGMLLALAGTARGMEAMTPIGLGVVGGQGWHAENDFEVFWTDPPEWQVGGASWQASGPGTVGPAQFVPGLGISELDHLHVPADGEWGLAVWLRDTGGWELSAWAATARLRLDEVPPALSFVSGDAQELPPQLVAEASDPLSGVAGGTISYRRLDQDHWAGLPTQIRSGAFGTELAAATPQLQPGTAYAFRAEATDAAGNAGETTMRADGAPMSFTTPPAGGAGGARGGERPGGRATRLEAVLAGGRGSPGGRAARGGRDSGTRLTVDAGAPAVLRGRLASADGGLARRPLRVVVRPAAGARGGTEAEAVTTDGSGRFELRLPPGPSRRIAVVFAGGDGLRPTRRRLSLRVRGAVTLRATPRRLRTGGLLQLGGRVGSRGARIPPSGKLVTISYRERETRRWRPVIVTRTDRAGRFRASYRFRYVTGRARIWLRATAPAESEWPYAPGSSPPLTVEVRDR